MFRTRKHSALHASPHVFNVPLIRDSFLADGTKVSHLVFVPFTTLGADIPKPSQYKLHALLAAGVPLSPVSATILDSAPSSDVASKFLDSLDKSDNSNNSDNSNSDVQPSNNV
jgi:hypothetical protein